MEMPSSRNHPHTVDAAGGGTFSLGGELTVNRLGFGAMRITEDPEQGRRVLRRAVELGVNLIDTAEFYGPGVSERLIAEALHPYPDGLVIATKGLPRRPKDLREAVEGSLRRLRVDRIQLYQLARIDPKVPAEDQVGALADLREQGKIPADLVTAAIRATEPSRCEPRRRQQWILNPQATPYAGPSPAGTVGEKDRGCKPHGSRSAWSCCWSWSTPPSPAARSP
jgi:Aldo/keto reductase family